uniref:Uncharacterized protein n=1 Tax=Macaca fascicularis TaxID=9541 RepID=A0A7N9D6N1_MACFA
PLRSTHPCSKSWFLEDPAILPLGWSTMEWEVIMGSVAHACNPSTLGG